MCLRSLNYLHIITVIVSVLFSLVWLIINFTGISSNEYIRNLYTDSYWVIALFGGVSGILASKQWGGRSSSVGNFILFLSLGLILQAFGQIIYAIYFLLLHVDVPYPSLGDVAYLSSVFAYVASTWYLARVLGVLGLIRKTPTKLFLLIIPLIILFISYRIFIWDYDWTDWYLFKLVMDFGQPLAQVIYISVVFVTLSCSWKKIGGVMRSAIILVMLAFFLQYVSDFYYAYRATYGGWKPAYISDLMYVFTYFVTSQSIYMFSKGYHSLLNK